MLNYAEQIYDIMVEEIQTGRWKIDERLPGVMHLARQLGFGTKTVQTAYDRLKQDGYVRSLGYRGTYLRSLHPSAATPTGRIGILVAEPDKADPLVLWYEHVLLKVAQIKGLLMELKALPSAMSFSEALTPGAFFAADVEGVVSLSSFQPSRMPDDPAKMVPYVFLCPPYEACSPKVCADVQEAYENLTAQIIRTGHTRIAFSEDAFEPDPRQTTLHRTGFDRAMAAAALVPDDRWTQKSRSLLNHDLPAITAFLKSTRKLRCGPTAIVAGSLGRAMAILRAAPLAGIAIPGDLSVASIGSAPVEGFPGRQISGMLPHFERMAGLCLELLDQQKSDGHSDFTEIRLRMHFVPGHTLAPPHTLTPDRPHSPASVRPGR